MDLVSTPGFDQDVSSIPKNWKSGGTELSRLRGSDMYNRKYSMPIEELATYWEDFDADKKGVYSDQWRSKVDEDEYVVEEYGLEREGDGEFNFETQRYATCLNRRHLDGPEPVDRSFVMGYLKNLLFRNRGNELSAYEYKYGTQNIVSAGSDDDDEVAFEVDFKSIYSKVELTTSEMYACAQEMLFHMKRLYRFGGEKGVHVLSFIKAYLRAQYRINQDKIASKLGQMSQRSVTRKITYNSVVEEGFYLSKLNGDPLALDETGMVTKSMKSKKGDWMFSWLHNRTEKYESYLEDYDALIYEASLLHIDLMNEDMLQFNAEFWDNIVVSYITPDSQFLKDLPKRLRTNEPLVKAHMFENSYEQTIKNYNLAVDIVPELIARKESIFLPRNYKDCMTNLKQFFNGNDSGENYMYNAREELKRDRGLNYKIIDPEKIEFKNAIAIYEGKPLILDCSGWYKYAGLEEYKTEKHYCILTNLFLFLEINTDEFNICYIDDAYQAFFYFAKPHTTHYVDTREAVDVKEEDLRQCRKSWRTLELFEDE